MNILVTGAKGFVGKNLCCALKNLRDGKDKTRPSLKIDKIYEYDLNTEVSLLDEYCANADFVFNLAGVNRPKNNSEFMEGNFGFSSTLLDTLKKHKNTCPVMLSSSIQATLIGRYGTSNYGKSKLAGENLFFDYATESGAKVLVYRFPNLFGKWCKPNYNSAVATFCYNMANDLPIIVNDRSTELELLYIDDLVSEMLDALEGKEHHCEFDGVNTVLNNSGKYCAVPITHHVTLGKIVDLLDSFKAQPETLVMPEIPEGSFAKKLCSTYLSYLPAEKVVFPLHMNADARGSFTELLKTASCGQFSVNISKPGITKGQHWHNSKWEFFIVVAGHGLIQERKIGTDEVLSFEVNGDEIKAVHMLPGYTHNIINLSDTENLITLMWANEQFNQNHPDTFWEPV
ncbi:MAG: NAD-dependent epimerase/dehydratase family protein [Clostridiales bacterium]|jgi:UDP-2-acetamido-2,6-beta-L-arabino-hexul-4-ose reductase|nr:NAD-dependent epimerase/dehydratase family protein [Clostridiales bacterium]MCI2161010.1 NAD-dependent epimerase/dehydratase family protein [Oscillospiraceae bacterium]MCI1962090.1 NAD-dependent epimerase/dehydratase family protein [Clostridiales bacterium]MCI2022532.1 NAD-dependent epimerase/dehydratase family protein [Clostridiales bacterium]MCI2027153.1 NAD-dependent epimerase/dehydratase family protein [Clostridiales bacterium]